ncbi:uncharacterized protein LOC5515249 isoform X2 [Nematostella vectensis]|uniref:uncharacterized protein LOC5515249 isoform X2 n=1 Tax=Nematostella vectensis TaxID=45351 RepID=UPI0020778CD8|nr:uncharacterized protein LOC5515249 isoform X2 [Nematostella vectensis]
MKRLIWKTTQWIALLVASLGVLLCSIVSCLDCGDNLGLVSGGIHDYQLSASSYESGEGEPWYGRLGDSTKKNWCASTQDTNQYLQIDLGPNEHSIMAVATQGAHNYDSWVLTYTMSVSHDGKTWEDYKEGGSVKVFSGNTDRKSIVKHKLDPAPQAVYVRFQPKTWSGDLCMRVELYGCYVLHAAVGLEDGNIPNANFHSRSGTGYSGRLNHADGLRPDATHLETFQIDLGPEVQTVTAVATQGAKTKDEWTKNYTLSYTLDGTVWYKYKELGEVKIFEGNWDRDTVVTNRLHHNITARYLRFDLYMYYQRPSIRAEVYGGKACDTAFGIENKTIPDSSINASSVAGPGYEPAKARLNGNGAWCGVFSTDGLYVDLGKVRKISKVGIQGHPTEEKWTSKIKLHYSVDGLRWYIYEPTRDKLEHTANGDKTTVVYLLLVKARRARYVMFQPVTWQSAPCMRVEIYGCDDCNDAMGLQRYELPDKSLSASSTYYAGHEPWLGRLWEQRGEGAWCALENDGNQFLQLDFGHPVRVRGVATQGKYRKSWWAIKEYAWVKTFKLSYAEYSDEWSYSGYIGRWKSYSEDGSTHKVFAGNIGHDVARHTLSRTLLTRYLRFVPVTYHGWTCLRVEVFGCKVCDEPLGMEELHIKKEDLLESSGYNMISGGERPDFARLNYPGTTGWRPNIYREKKWLQVDLGSERAYVTAVATQGDRRNSYRGIAKYSLSFSLNQLDWADYQEEWETRIFAAEKIAFQVTKIYLRHKTLARYVRFWTEEEIETVVMSVEVYGCRGASPLLSGPSAANSATYPKYYTGNQTKLIYWHGEPAINSAAANATWCGTSGEFLRVDFGSVKHVRAVYVQGHPSEAKWVTKIKFNHSADGLFFKSYIGYHEVKAFDANVDTHKIVRFSMDPDMTTRFLHIIPDAFNGAPCMRIAIYGDKPCSDPLGVESGLIDNKAIRATSWITIDDNPKNARLNNIEGEGAWCPRTVDQSQFLEINIGHVTRVTSVATQGRFPVAECHVIDAWVTKFALEYLDLDGMAWKNYTEQGVIKIFSGNTDLISTVNNVLTEKLITKAVKFRPKEWHTRICMRVELYGCKEYFKPIGMENHDISNENNFHIFDRQRNSFRLNHPRWSGILSDCLEYHQDAMYVRVIMGKTPFRVVGIGMQGRNYDQHMVVQYTLQYSSEGTEWYDYMEDGEIKYLTTTKYYDTQGVAVRHFRYSFVAQQVMIWTVEHLSSPCFRVEFYGYKVESEPMVSNSTAMNSSSAKTGYEPSKAKLLLGSSHAWCASDGNHSFIQVDLGSDKIVNEVAVGGLLNGKGRVSTFRLSSSKDGYLWKDYKHGDKPFKVFTVSGNTYEATKHALVFPISARHVRVHPITWDISYDTPCLTLQLYGKGDCEDALGLQEWRIPRSAISASSRISTNYMPWMARLDSTEYGGAWCARRNAVGEYLQVDIGFMARVTAIVLQGKESPTELPSLPEAWVKLFVLWFSDDRFTWEEYKVGGLLKKLKGNNDGKSKTTVEISGQLITRFIRIYPQTWQNHICMRTEIIGCEYCGKSLGMESYHIPTRAIHASSIYNDYQPKHARLNVFDGESFIFNSNLPGEFMEIDLGPAMKRVSGFAIQGRIHGTDFLNRVAVAYSRDGVKYVSHLDEDGREKIFKGAWGRYVAFKRRIHPHIFTRYIRIVQKSAYNHPSLRVEIYGCDCTEVLAITNLTASSEESGAEVTKNWLLSAAWCARADDTTPYLEADLQTPQVITSILTFGHPVSEAYVASYSVSFSEDKKTWQKYVERDYLQKAMGAITKIIQRNFTHEGHVVDLQFPFKARYVRVWLGNMTSGRCMKVQFFGRDACKADLGMQTSLIPDSSVSASSTRNLGYKPSFARIGRHYGNGAWCAANDTLGEYLQVDLGFLHRVTGVALQAKLKDTQGFVEAWVKLFIIFYSSDGSTWNEHKENGESKVKEFPGPSSKYDTSKVDLTPAVYARFIRIAAISWETHVCMRIELYGCRACGDALGLEDFRIPDNAITASRTNGNFLPKYARFGYDQIGWFPSNKDLDNYLQVDLGKSMVVTGVATQFVQQRTLELKEYALEFSQDGTTWTMHKNNSGNVIFEGHRSHLETVRNDLAQNITARYVRLRPRLWAYELMIKMELYGCKA